MALYHAYLEVDDDGTCLAHVPDLAGCTAGGQTRDAAVAALPDAIRAYLDWCGAHGDPLPDDGAIEIALAQVVSGCRPWRHGGANALFSADRAPLGDSELRTYLRRMSYARGDLLELARSIPPHKRDVAPGDGHLSILEVLTHLVETEIWHLSRLGQRIGVEPPPPDILDRLVDGRARAVEAILRLSPRQRDLVYIPTEQPGENPEEGWTLRKMLRGLLEHELVHLRELQSRRLTVGTSPNITP
jgi:predicted RNase H-like HicB family nuclease